MKKFCLLLVCLCAGQLTAAAQTGVGLRGGPLFSQVQVARTNRSLQSPQQALVQGFEAGVLARFMNSKHLGLQVELNYSRQGWDIYLLTEAEHKRELEVVQLPILSFLQMGRGRFKFTVQAGAFGGYILSRQDLLLPPTENRPPSLVVYDHQEELNWQYGILAGGGPAYHSPIGVLQLEGRFVMALSDLLKADFKRSDDFDAFRLQSITFGLQWVYMF